GRYAFCDTDSLFVTGLSLEQLSKILARFESLNPFDRELVPGSILEIEKENFDPDTGKPWQLQCFSIAAKRYVLFVQGPDGRPRIVKSLEHGLGHLLSPDGEDDFYGRWWEHLLCLELGIIDPEPAWFSDVAAGRLTVTSSYEEQTFRRLNSGRP